jgi:DNA polymerase
VLVCLGATAAQALRGKTFRMNSQRGRLIDSELAQYATGTVHPSSILRAPDDAVRQAQMAAFVNDLRKIAKLLRSRRAHSASSFSS